MINKATYISEWKRKSGKYLLIAVCPIAIPGSGTLKFMTYRHGMNCEQELDGKLIEDGDERFTFEANDSKGNPSGHFEFKLLKLPEFRRTISKQVSYGDTIASACHTTEDLWEWYRRNWGRHTFDDYLDYLADERRKKGLPDPETRW